MKNLKNNHFENQNSTTLLSDFKNSLDSLMKNKSYRQVGAELGVSHNTIKALENVKSVDELYFKSPKLVALILSMSLSLDLPEVLKLYKDDFKMFKKQIKSHLNEVGDDLVNFDFKISTNEATLASIQDCLSDPTTLKIYYLTKRTGGISVAELTKKFGESHLEHIDKLNYNGLLLKKNDLYFADPARYIHFDRKNIQKIIPVLNNFYTTDLSGQERNFIYFRQHTITREAQKELIKIHNKFMTDSNKILNDNKCIGDIPFYSFAQAGEIN